MKTGDILHVTRSFSKTSRTNYQKTSLEIQDPSGRSRKWMGLSLSRRVSAKGLILLSASLGVFFLRHISGDEGYCPGTLYHGSAGVVDHSAELC